MSVELYPAEEGYEVMICDETGSDPSVLAYTQGGYDHTRVPVKAVLAWVKKNRPDLLGENELAEESSMTTQGNREGETP